MGLITTAGSIGRIVFPLIVDYLDHFTIMLIAAGSSLFCAVGIVLFRDLATATNAAGKARAATILPSITDDDNLSVSSRISVTPSRTGLNSVNGGQEDDGEESSGSSSSSEGRSRK